MKIIVYALLLILTGNGVIAQTDFFNQGGTPSKNYFIELPYENIKGKLIVNVVINGKERRFLFDTGATVVIYEDIAKEIGLDTMHINDVTDSQGAKLAAPFSIIDRIKIGEVFFENIPVILFSDDFISECFDITGVIGSNLLRNSIVQFDTNRKVIIITDIKRTLDLNRKNASKMYLNNQSSPYFKAHINNKENDVILFDSGADAIYDICIPHYRYFNSKNVFSDSIKGFGVNSGGFFGFAQENKKVKVKLNTFKIGNGTLTNFWAETNLGNHSKAGSEILNYGKVTLDYMHSKFYFEPYQDIAEIKNKEWPIGPIFKDGKLYVGLVWENCKQDIELGDEIIEIDETPLHYDDLCDFIMNVSLEDKEEVLVTLKNDEGLIKKVKIRKE